MFIFQLVSDMLKAKLVHERHLAYALMKRAPLCFMPTSCSVLSILVGRHSSTSNIPQRGLFALLCDMPHCTAEHTNGSFVLVSCPADMSARASSVVLVQVVPSWCRLYRFGASCIVSVPVVLFWFWLCRVGVGAMLRTLCVILIFWYLSLETCVLGSEKVFVVKRVLICSTMLVYCRVLCQMCDIQSRRHVYVARALCTCFLHARAIT